ncbi:MAG: hypothetical protein J7559_12320 [Cohnella sp.]|nr:hypothetical protein [Cohnella sp.]
MADKDQLEKEHSTSMNTEAVEKIKAEAKASVDTWFEEGRSIKLLDGKTYEIKPIPLKLGRKLMKLLGSLILESVLLNFADTGNEEEDEARIRRFYETLTLAFHSNDTITAEYLDEYCNFSMAAEIFQYVVEVNGIKK